MTEEICNNNNSDVYFRGDGTRTYHIMLNEYQLKVIQAALIDMKELNEDAARHAVGDDEDLLIQFKTNAEDSGLLLDMIVDVLSEANGEYDKEMVHGFCL